jgi:ABC-type Fe3+ transport system permease subunit
MVSAAPAIRFHNEGVTRETTIARVLLVLVFAPAGGLFGKAVAEAAQTREWWPWLVAALVWLVLSGAISLAVSNHVDDRH